MNIIVKLHKGEISCRPDTTLERECHDIYTPDFVEGWMFAPVLFARISKAGKCVGEKFAGRYYDSAGYGVLLSPANIPWGTCLDHTSILPQEMYAPDELEGNIFSLRCDGKEIFSTESGQSVTNAIESSLCEASRYVSLRIGDLIAVELANPAPIETKSPGICGTLGDSEIFRFSIL